jgi:hypothetical protein
MDSSIRYFETRETQKETQPPLEFEGAQRSGVRTKFIRPEGVSSFRAHQEVSEFSSPELVCGPEPKAIYQAYSGCRLRDYDSVIDSIQRYI